MRHERERERERERTRARKRERYKKFYNYLRSFVSLSSGPENKQDNSFAGD